jgi:hypothetical protein
LNQKRIDANSITNENDKTIALCMCVVTENPFNYWLDNSEKWRAILGAKKTRLSVGQKMVIPDGIGAVRGALGGGIVGGPIGIFAGALAGAGANSCIRGIIYGILGH